MITFLNIAFLLGLPLVAAPVAVHLLNRRRREMIDWGAMQFLLEALPRKRRFWQMDDRLLMLLRCLAVVLFVLAIARPLLRSSWFGTSGQRDIVLVIDTSMSTARQAKQGTAFDDIRHQAERALSALHHTDRVRVLVAGQTPQWLEGDFARLTAPMRSEIRAELAQLRPTLGSVDWPRCIDEAAAAFDNAQSVHGIAVFTDRQAHGWRAQAGPVWRGLHGLLDAGRGGAIANVITAPPIPSGANLAVNSITALRTRVGVGEPVSANATVSNTGTGASEPAMLTWLQGSTALGISPIKALAPGEKTNLAFEYPFETAGVFDLRARIDRRDVLDLDNESSLIVEAIESVPILIVDGTAAENTIENQARYLQAALGRFDEPEPKDRSRWASVFQAQLVTAENLPAHDFSDFPAIVLANVSSLDAKLVGRLHAFVESGGGLWLLPGDGLDLTRFNATFCAGEAALAPVALEPAVDDAGSAQVERIIPPVEPHPATLLLGDTTRLDLDRVQVTHHYRLAASADLQTSVLLRLSNNTPVAIHRMLGRGHVILQTLPMGTAWSNLPLHQAYVVWVNEWLSWLASPTATQWNLTPGQTASIPLDPDLADEAVLVTPGGQMLKVASTLQSDRRVFRPAAVRVPGRYELKVREANGVERAFPLVVHRDPDESDLTLLTPEESQALSTAAGLRFVNQPLDGFQSRGPVTPRSQPIWALLLAALIVLMIAELLLAGTLTRRRLAPSPAIEREPIAVPTRVPARSA